MKDCKNVNIVRVVKKKGKDFKSLKTEVKTFELKKKNGCSNYQYSRLSFSEK